MKLYFALTFGLLATGCASENLSKTNDTESKLPPSSQAVSLEVYEVIQCAHCDRDFERVAVPDDYKLPTDDLAECLAYVLDKEPEDQNVLFSAWMECVEKSPEIDEQ